MRPCVVLGNQLNVIGPANWVEAPQVEPPVVEEMKPTSNWQVEEEQLAEG